MVVQIRSKKEYQGLAEDTKPVLQAGNSGSTFYEVDTGKKYVFHVDGWVEIIVPVA